MNNIARQPLKAIDLAPGSFPSADIGCEFVGGRDKSGN
jgi:hypothetical protein